MTNLQKAGSLMGILFAFSLFYYFTVEGQKPPMQTFTKPPAMSGAAALPTASVPMPKGIRSIKPEAVKKLKLPDEIKNDTTKHVTTTATVPKSKGGYDIVSVTDDSGVTEILTKEKPPALFSMEHGGRVGIGIGLDTRSGQAAKVFAEYTPLTVLGVSVGVEGQVNYHPTSLNSTVSMYGGVLLFKSF